MLPKTPISDRDWLFEVLKNQLVILEKLRFGDAKLDDRIKVTRQLLELTPK